MKIVIEGDGGVGKTSLAVVFSTDIFPEEYVPTIFDNYTKTVCFKGKSIQLMLWDIVMRSEEADRRLRPLSYPQTDVFLLCFSIDKLTSYESIKTKWFPLVSHHCPHAAIILCGMKLDLREDQDTINKLQEKGLDIISFEQGTALASEIGAASYVECSARQRKYEHVFTESVRVVSSSVRTTNNNGQKCIVQ